MQQVLRQRSHKKREEKVWGCLKVDSLSCIDKRLDEKGGIYESRITGSGWFP